MKKELFSRGYSVKEMNKQNKHRNLKNDYKTKGFMVKKHNKKKVENKYKSIEEGLVSYQFKKELEAIQERYNDAVEKLEKRRKLHMEKELYVKRGDIVYCQLEDLGEGSEQQGRRPAVVIQNNTGNLHSGTTIVAFLTTREKAKLPTHVTLIHSKDDTLAVRINKNNSHIVLCEQVRTISKSRILNKLGEVKPEAMLRIDKALLISQGIDLEKLK